jgi:hypothetical protein
MKRSSLYYNSNAVFLFVLRNVISVFQVDTVISTQFGMMKTEQQATAVEASNLSSKAWDPNPENLSQPGPSGLSGRANKTEHSITGRFLVHRYKLSLTFSGIA